MIPGANAAVDRAQVEELMGEMEGATLVQGHVNGQFNAGFAIREQLDAFLRNTYLS